MDVHGISKTFVREYEYKPVTDVHQAEATEEREGGYNTYTRQISKAIMQARQLVRDATSMRESSGEGVAKDGGSGVSISDVEEEVRRVVAGGGMLVEGTPVVLQAMAIGCEVQDRPVLGAADWAMPKQTRGSGGVMQWNWRWVLAVVERCRLHSERVDSVAQRDADSFYLWLGSNSARAFQARLEAGRRRKALKDSGAEHGGADGGVMSFGFLRYTTAELDAQLRQAGQYGLHAMTNRKMANKANLEAHQRGLEAGVQTSPPPLARHLGWFRRLPTKILFDGERDNIRVAAAVCVYDDGRFLEQVVAGVLDDVEHVLILLSATPWHGQRRDISATAAAAWRAVKRANDQGRVGAVSIVSGAWATEGDQREYANRMLEELPVLVSTSANAADGAAAGGAGRARTGKLTHALVLDADEFYDPVELRRMFILAARNPEAPWFRAAMATYFRTLRTIITPPENLRILWLVKLGAAHIDGREGVGGREFQPLNGKTIHESSGRCHHISYVRTTNELLHKKFASFQHAKEVEDALHQEGGIAAWVRQVWRRWRAEPNITNLHPIEPPAYASTALMPLMDMPPVLRQMHTCYCLRHQPHRQRQYATNGAAGAFEFDIASNDFGCNGGSNATAGGTNSPSWLWRDQFDTEADEEVRSMLCDAKWPRQEATGAPSSVRAGSAASLLPPISGVLTEDIARYVVAAEQVCTDSDAGNGGGAGGNQGGREGGREGGRDKDEDDEGLDTASVPATTISDMEARSLSKVIYRDEEVTEVTEVTAAAGTEMHINSSSYNTCTRFLVVVIGEGAYDSSTKGTFDDIAALIASGVQELGYDVDVTFCQGEWANTVQLLSC
jgi:hypothetical protein